MAKLLMIKVLMLCQIFPQRMPKSCLPTVTAQLWKGVPTIGVKINQSSQHWALLDLVTLHCAITRHSGAGALV